MERIYCSCSDRLINEKIIIINGGVFNHKISDVDIFYCPVCGKKLPNWQIFNHSQKIESENQNLNKIDLQEIDLQVINHRLSYRNHRRDKDDNYWYRMLAEEFAELTLALEGKHEHCPDLELMQIAGICINWLEKRQEESED